MNNTLLASLIASIFFSILSLAVAILYDSDLMTWLFVVNMIASVRFFILYFMKKE